MENGVNSVGLSLVSDQNLTSGIGYIAIPADISREEYIRDCYRNMRVSLHTAHDGFLNRVKVSKFDLNFIDFPGNYRELGTPVYYITEPTTGEKYILKTFSKTDQLGTGVPNEFELGREFGHNTVQISGNAEKGCLNIVVSNEDEASLNINVLNKSDKGKVSLNVRGGIDVVTSADINVVSNGQLYNRVFDAENREMETGVTQTINAFKFKTPSFNINNGKENFVLGQKYKSLLEGILEDIGKLVAEVSNSTVTVQGAIVPLNNKVQLMAYKQLFEVHKKKVEDTLSEVGYIDK